MFRRLLSTDLLEDFLSLADAAALALGVPPICYTIVVALSFLVTVLAAIRDHLAR